ncbi:MAG: aminotransferase class I/II-fold pyridoxal phosphate-dependent enzyme, partial [bacterium]|nr:aminotransferase class I/II-fold pyridoxal phosphate-dependent enzyme [bacterium]
MNISKRAQDIQESPIRKLAPVAVAAKNRGTTIYHLNIGQPDIHTPEDFYRNIDDYKKKVLAYGPSDGLPELKEAMVDYFSCYDIGLEPGNICVTSGGSEAISFVFAAIGNPGDEVLVFEPFYTNYNGFATFLNLNLVPVETKAEEG